MLLAAAVATMPPKFNGGDWDFSAGPASTQLIALPGDEFQASYAGLPRTRFGAFPAPYDIEALDVFAGIEGDDDEGRSLRAAIAIRRRGITKYYRLADPDGDDLDAADEAPSEREQPPLDIRFGTPDRTLPIIRIALVTTFRGAHSGSATESDSFIDFGFSTPKIIAGIESTRGWMGGACTAYDAMYEVKSSGKCSWNAAERDYDCALTRELDTDWRTRHAVMNVSLFTGRRTRVANASLQRLADEVRADRSPWAPRVLAHVGTLRPAALLADRWFLFVGTGSGYELTARIYAVDMTTTAAAEEVPMSDLRDTDDERSVPDLLAADGQPFTLVDHDFYVGVRSLTRERKKLNVVSMLLTENDHRALFWIGGDAATGDLDALRIASDAPVYDGCNSFEVPDSASEISVATAPFAATLRIEPHWTADPDISAAVVKGDEESCVRIAHVTWSDGFDVEDTQAECRSGPPAKRVLIGEHGELSTAPLSAKPAD